MPSALVARISRSAVASNLRLLRDRLAPGVRLWPVVKADCYGHGVELLRETVAAGSDGMVVTTAEEALHLRELGYAGRVVMLFAVGSVCSADSGPDGLEALIRRQVDLTVTAAGEARRVAEAARAAAMSAAVHVHVDSGMGRGGVLWTSAAEVIAAVRSSPELRLAGLSTHFATADEDDKAFTRRQLGRFLDAAGETGDETAILHAANSAAVLDLPDGHLRAVRPGIAVYGYPPSDLVGPGAGLRPCLRLVAPLMQVKRLPAGTAVGYGRTRRFDRETVVGLVPVGYADGYFRCLSNRARMRVDGALVPVAGRVSMDQVILDLTRAARAKVGDEVEIISPDPSDPHSVENLAKLAGTISYEITSALHGRVRWEAVDRHAVPAHR